MDIKKLRCKRCVMVVLLFAIVFVSLTGCNKNSNDLPKLTLSQNNGQGGVYFVDDISDFDIGNPWHDGISLNALPVYKNKVLRNGAGEPLSGLSLEQMNEKLTKISAYLNKKIETKIIQPSAEEIEMEKAKGKASDRAKQPYAVSAKLKDVEIKIETEGTSYITFNRPIVLKSGSKLNFPAVTNEEIKEAISHLIEEYTGLLGFKSHAISTPKYYNFDGEATMNYNVYESSGDITQQMLGFAYNNASFEPDKKGDLQVITRRQTDLSEQVGVYPIIDLERAKQMLFEGKYLSLSYEAMTDKSQVVKAELIYGYSPWDIYHMPYYRFYVRTSQEAEELSEGLTGYGLYYVPAVEPHFIDNMPLN